MRSLPRRGGGGGPSTPSQEERLGRTHKRGTAPGPRAMRAPDRVLYLFHNGVTWGSGRDSDISGRTPPPPRPRAWDKLRGIRTEKADVFIRFVCIRTSVLVYSVGGTARKRSTRLSPGGAGQRPVTGPGCVVRPSSLSPEQARGRNPRTSVRR